MGHAVTGFPPPSPSFTAATRWGEHRAISSLNKRILDRQPRCMSLPNIRSDLSVRVAHSFAGGGFIIPDDYTVTNLRPIHASLWQRATSLSEPSLPYIARNCAASPRDAVTSARP